MFDRVPLVSVVPLAQWELREPLVSLEALVLLVPLDPRWVLLWIYHTALVLCSHTTSNRQTHNLLSTGCDWQPRQPRR